MPDPTDQAATAKAAKNTVAADVAATPATVVESSFPLTLTEFCSRLSGEIQSVEMIAGFYTDEAAAGQVKGTEADFRARYALFVNRPA